jgi:hypothetical protein
MVQSRQFETLDEFNRGYAGPQTLLLEKKSRGKRDSLLYTHLKSSTSNQRHIELAGKQDDFCLICGDDEAELFPQLGSKEIHLCPRQFCKKCYHIEADWKKNSVRFNDGIYRECKFVPLCCTLCWKRGWDIISPLLGPEQPEWQTWTGERMEDILNRRYKHWEECAVNKEFEKHFKWRLPLRYLSDDMTLESDRKLLKAIKNGFLKNSKRFNKFEKTAILEASPPSGASFNVGGAFDDIVRRLLKLTSPTVMEVGAEGGVAEEEEEGQGDGEEEDLEAMGQRNEEQETAEERRQEPLQMNTSRPQRQAAQFGFVKVKGVPVRQSRCTPQDSTTNASEGNAQDMLDQQISNSMGAESPPLHTRRLVHPGTPTQDKPRPRGCPRKSLTAPTSLPPSPSTQGGDTTPGPCFMHNEMADVADSEDDESFDQIKAIIDNKHKQNRKLKQDKAKQEAQLRLVKEELEHSQARAEKLVHEREALSTIEADLRRVFAATRAANEALQRTVAGSKEEHERQLETIAKLNGRIAQQAEQITGAQHLEEEIEEHRQKWANIQADLEISRAREAELKNEIADQHEAYDELQETIEKAEERSAILERENREFVQGLARRQQELEELKKATGTMDRKSRAIRGLREDQDEVMEANKQLRKDIANLGAELMIERGFREVDGALLHQELVRGSLAADLVDRLVQNPFLEVQISEKLREQAVLGRSSSDSQRSQRSGAKRRRTNPIADTTEPSYI